MQQIVLGMDGTSQYFSRFRLKLYKIGKHLNMFADFFSYPCVQNCFYGYTGPIVFPHHRKIRQQQYANDGGYEAHI